MHASFLLLLFAQTALLLAGPPVKDTASVKNTKPACLMDQSKEGTLFGYKNNDTRYLMIDGCLKLIPNNNTFNNLFRENCTIVKDVDFSQLCKCDSFSCDAMLGYYGDIDKKKGNFLITNGVQRWFYSMEPVRRYCFDLSKAKQMKDACRSQMHFGPALS